MADGVARRPVRMMLQLISGDTQLEPDLGEDAAVDSMRAAPHLPAAQAVSGDQAADEHHGLVAARAPDAMQQAAAPMKQAPDGGRRHRRCTLCHHEGLPSPSSTAAASAEGVGREVRHRRLT